MITLVAPIHSQIEVPTDIHLIRRYMNGHDFEASDEDIQWAYREWCKAAGSQKGWIPIWEYRYLGSLYTQLPSAANNVIFLLQGGMFEERERGVHTMVIDGKDTTPDKFRKTWQKDVDSPTDWRYNLDMTNDTEIKQRGF